MKQPILILENFSHLFGWSIHHCGPESLDDCCMTCEIWCTQPCFLYSLLITLVTSFFTVLEHKQQYDKQLLQVLNSLYDTLLVHDVSLEAQHGEHHQRGQNGG